MDQYYVKAFIQKDMLMTRHAMLCYVNHCNALPQLFQTIGKFTITSGPKLNPKETYGLRLTLDGDTPPQSDNYLLLEPPHNIRYLGIHVGMWSAMDRNWETVILAAKVRIVLTKVKLLSLIQRCIVIKTIVFPNIAYVARHEWPSECWINKLRQHITNYAWTGLFPDTVKQNKAWVKQSILKLPLKMGSIYLPIIQ